MNELPNEKNHGESHPSPGVGLVTNDIPKARSSMTGVSVRYVHDLDKSWHVFRVPNGSEDTIFDLIVEDGTYAYIAKRYARIYVNRKPKRVLENFMPGLLFVYVNRGKAEEYVRNVPVLSYYDYPREAGREVTSPLTIPFREMENFIIATCNRNEHLLFVEKSQCHFKGSGIVQVVDGTFRGVKGRLARVAGQQRVVVTLSHVGMVSTAYIPTAFLSTLCGSH